MKQTLSSLRTVGSDSPHLAPIRRTAYVRIIGLALATVIAAPATAASPTIEFSSCRLRGIDTAVRCAQFAVPESAVNADKTIRIHVAVLPALARKAEPDPVYFFAGGPGQAASDIGPLVAALSDLRKKRDIVLVDQRGTGKSKTLTCKSPSADTSKADPITAAFSTADGAERAEWAGCLATLQGNPAAHRTDDYIDDLEAVRKALGHVRINVWGGSYGSRVALRYLKRHPASIRTAVLDGVAPTTLRLPDDALATSEAQLRAVLAACTASEGCNKAYPNALAAFDRLLAELRSKPPTVSLPHPATGKPLQGVMSDRKLMSLLWPLLYKPESARLIPALLGQAAQSNFAPLLSTLAASSITEGDIAVAQRFAVMCAEDMLGRSPAPNPRFQALTDLFYSFCKDLPHGKVAPEFFEPTTGDAPVLLLSGAADPVTPPAQAELAAKTLARSRQIVVPNSGHIVSPLPCLRRVIVKFVEAGDIAAAKDNCEADLKLPPPLFYVSPLEARP